MVLALILTSLLAATAPAAASDFTGAWREVQDDGTYGVWIVTDREFAIAWYRQEPRKFLSTEGGTWTKTDDGVRLTYEFDTANPARIGTTRTIPVSASGDKLTAGNRTWDRIDGSAPGGLRGAWLMTGRKRDGEISRRQPGARRTMKILSGTRFQWIAYNVETKEFFGTGGGTYAAGDGKYTENIEFFSRDDSRSGQSLPFQYELIDGEWHHIGKSTKGEAMHEVWTRREKVSGLEADGVK